MPKNHPNCNLLKGLWRIIHMTSFRIKDGNAEALFPRSSFTINCTGKVSFSHVFWVHYLCLLWESFSVCIYHCFSLLFWKCNILFPCRWCLQRRYCFVHAESIQEVVTHWFQLFFSFCIWISQFQHQVLNFICTINWGAKSKQVWQSDEEWNFYWEENCCWEGC